VFLRLIRGPNDSLYAALISHLAYPFDASFMHSLHSGVHS
jgi:hypothetical protein